MELNLEEEFAKSKRLEEKLACFQKDWRVSMTTVRRIWILDVWRSLEDSEHTFGTVRRIMGTELWELRE